MTTPAVLDTREEWATDALDWIARRARGAIITADDLRRHVRPSPHPNDVGNLFKTAKSRGLISRGIHRTSRSRSRHHGGLHEWIKC